MKYEKIATKYSDSLLAYVYKKTAGVETKHADRRAAEMKKLGGELSEFKPKTRTRILVWMVESVGPESVLSSLQAGEQNGADAYAEVKDASVMSSEEKSHNR
jgi:rubrerythrin